MSPKTEPDLISVMDTTLRDGEQTPDVAYSPAEKLQLARILLKDVGVDRIEIASTRVSEGEQEAARRIAKWARQAHLLRQVEILGFCDGGTSVNWICGVGAKVLNLLTKGSERHCREQLRLTPEQHRAQIEETVRLARRRRLVVNVYLEDWSSGVKDSFDYVFSLIQLLRELRVARIYLPDTLGIQSPDEVTRYVGLMTSTWPDVDFEYHAHNDYALATANCLAAVRAGARGVHTSVNGMGERAGNTKLAEIVAAIHDHTSVHTAINESRLASVSRMVETFSGKEVAANAPIIGRDVFTQTAGIHADGDAKGDLYATRLAPARFGRTRRYALGKLAGKASLDHNLKSLGIDLPEEARALVLQRIIELGDRKKIVSPEDLPYLIADVLERPDERLFRVQDYRVTTSSQEAPHAEVVVSYLDQVEKTSASGDGGYDAFMNALKKAAKQFEIDVPLLGDYRVRIPPGGRTHALVETVITWRLDSLKSGRRGTKEEFEGDTFSTIGVDTDQLAAAVIATEKMLNAIAPDAGRKKKTGSKSGSSKTTVSKAAGAKASPAKKRKGGGRKR